MSLGWRWPLRPWRQGSRPRGPKYSVACEVLHGGSCPGETPELSVPGPACPAGMEYKECVSPCTRTCQSLKINEVCQEQCVDGCSCPGNNFPLYLQTRGLASAVGLGRLDESHLCEVSFAEIRGLLFIFKKSSYRVVRLELAFTFMFFCCTAFMKACVSRKEKTWPGCQQ